MEVFLELARGLSALARITPQPDWDYASSADWRFDEVIVFGCVTLKGKDWGPRVGFVHWQFGAGYDVVAVDGPSLARWLISPACGHSQSVSDVLASRFGKPPVSPVRRRSCARQSMGVFSTLPPTGVSSFPPKIGRPSLSSHMVLLIPLRTCFCQVAGLNPRYSACVPGRSHARGIE